MCTRAFELAGGLTKGLNTEFAMLSWALTFLMIAIVAAVFGIGGIAATSAATTQMIFVVFLILFAVSLFAGVIRRA